MIKLTIPHNSDHVYANTKYLFYSTYVEEELILSGAFDRFIYAVSGNFNISGHSISAGDSIHTVRKSMLVHGNGVLYVAQVTCDEDGPHSATVTRKGAHHIVSKPWGHELWLNGEHPEYAVKKIFIKAGNQTSLQYHNFKEETNLLEYGEAVLVYKSNNAIENDNVTSIDLAEHLMQGPCCMHVTPKTIHRLRAVTDIHLFEVSTAFLDDVVRIQDDNRRPSGRIQSEHE